MSGKPAARLGDIGSGHGCHYPPTPAISGSGDVLINYRPAFRQGDAYVPHPCPVCPAPPHPRNLSQGSPTVLVNNKQAGRVGDPISCGGAHSTGSGDVLIGGNSPPGLTREAFCETCEDEATGAS
ncbi:PAAR domain-containing protein [Litoreibacter janthinus]|uniref:Zn-binding Pro-Ala-Ala-Arg (PAAR) domain-containing protein, incolved in TypeVI secretion n=1 Tax=Litoreibacter janthinus TaxID=670154 RepID=A0A1I6HD28_9RHOB|nr:PAAR domain-containing protein [Litoreibacter janthinus]SFR52349.1 Zn-binding Pro-Ala-Ala-Arg (PAAR) domain-containing protein, incolved in TypeVI secretion [Litoreibacter janthinus]